MTIVHGFELLREGAVPELNLTARLYRHIATGAELLSLESADENKTFGVSFRTPPSDSTGLPHILEHAVLCGSRKYPVKEPFVELLKGSLQTFLNALTFADKTCYPVASQNLKDFYNLVDVYLDAVFYPRITREIFAQEGWHYELDEPSAPLTIKGVVYNEMKGAYSSPDGLVHRYSEQLLFPDCPYRHDSGGEPEAIPSLTYERFRAFHAQYYHPSNARFFFYGNDDPQERLRLVQGYLQDYGALAVDSAIPLQPPRDAPWRMSRPYPAGDDSDNQKAFVTVSWLLPENRDPALTLLLEILAYVLVGTPASPLHKALIDSGLGEEVIGAGLESELRQLYFSTGLKGVATENSAKIEPLILDTLERLAEEGIDPDMIEAALNTVEFNLREQNFGSLPRGVVLMVSALTTWLHGGDPIEAISFEGPLASVKALLERDPRALQGLIREHLLANPHRLTFVLEPDPTLLRRQEEAERARLEAVRAAMTPAAIACLIEETRTLRRLQETPDPPEALATIPRLGLEDLEREIRRVPTAIAQVGDAKVLVHDLFTNGIIYLDVGFDLHALPQELLPYLPMFSAALMEIGTEREDYVKLTQRIGQKTGGIRPATVIGARREMGDATAWLFLRAKATTDHADDLLAILRDILLTVRLDNRERFLQLLLEERASSEAELIPAGHRVVLARLQGMLTEAGWLTEQLDGVSQLFTLREMVAQVQQDWPAVLERLEAIRALLISRSTVLCNVTLDEANWARFEPRLAEFLAALPAAPLVRAAWQPHYARAHEGLTIPAQVNYVAKGGNLYELGYRLHGSAAVITQYLATTYLWERVRVQGGAYGAFCPFDQHSGVFAFASYRDPNLLATLATYDGCAAFLRALELPDEERIKSIIGTIGSLDAYQLPDAKGFSALKRHLVGYSDEERQRYRDEVLSTEPAHFRAFGEVLEALARAGLAVVLGAPEALQSANAELGGVFTLTKVL